MLVSQERLILDFHLNENFTNTHFELGDKHLAVLHLSETYSLYLEEFKNSHGIKMHAFYFNDFERIPVSSMGDCKIVQSRLKELLIAANHSEEYIAEVYQSFKRVLHDSLVQYHLEEYFTELEQQL